MVLLLTITLFLIHIVTCVIYNVTPDDTTCHHCHNLQHYLLNATKYFTSNTQLLFLPGLHHLHTNLIIQNVHNISLIGSTTNGTTPDTVIQCKSSVGIVMNNITSLEIKNMVIQRCLAKQGMLKASVIITSCSSVELYLIYVKQLDKQLSLYGVNILGQSKITHISCYAIYLRFTEPDVMTSKNHVLLLDQFKLIQKASVKHGIRVSLEQNTFTITLQISNTIVHHLKRYNFLYAVSRNVTNQSKLMIHNCQITDTISRYNLKLIKLFHAINFSIYLSKCRFFDNTIFKGVITAINSREVVVDQCIFHCNIVSILGRNDQGLINTKNVINLQVQHCYFYNNSGVAILVNPNDQYIIPEHLITTAVIENTTFLASLLPPTPHVYLTDFSAARLSFIGPVVFTNNDDQEGDGCIMAMANSIITLYNYIEFSQNNAFGIVMYRCTVDLDDCFIMNIVDSAILNITSNTIQVFFSAEVTPHLFHNPLYPPCFFQYLSGYHQKEKNHFSVTFSRNKYRQSPFQFHLFIHDFLNRFILRKSIYQIHTSHCYWLPQTVFINSTTAPMEINRQFIKYINNSQLELTKKKPLCYCMYEKHDCVREELGPMYPGQTLAVPLYAPVNFTYSIGVVAERQSKADVTSCVLSKSSELIQRIGRSCTMTYYTIVFPTDSWCELFLKVPHNKNLQYSIFYIGQLECPLGFIKLNGTCQCYPMFTKFGFTKCDINRQAILRPAHYWIYPALNKSHSYYISEKCPFYNCLPSPTYVHLSTPDTQCQFNRTGLLCGQCQHGFSTVFGSNQCNRCSNIFLLLLIPFMIAGILVILLLFLLNLTVNNGSINPYILYVNIIWINSTLIFPNHEHHTPVNIIIALANFDVGIQTCFYDGMDDYAKVWLQLVFPCYLVLLTIVLITVSQYSKKVYRFTAQRGIAVLATVLLLSYMKILSIVSSVLFNYSTIIHLPSNETTHVWAVDANVPLLSGKFIVLFIICIIVFVLLLLFSTGLLLNKVIQRFKFPQLMINKFKPLLDAYQGPYNTKHYYWTGSQLLMRVVFFGMSSLNNNTRLVTSIITLYIANILHGSCRPFISIANNYQQISLMTNLLVLHMLVFSGLGTVSVSVTIMIALAIIQFGFTITCHIMFYTVCSTVKQKILSWIKAAVKIATRK